MKKHSAQVQQFGYTRCKSITLNARAFHARQTTWETLVRGQYHLVWHPQWIDYALNRRPGASNVETVIGDPRFVRACAQFAAAGSAEFTTSQVTPEILREIKSPDAAKALNVYFAVQTNRAMEKLNCTDRSLTNQEEICATIRHQYFAQAGAFVVGARAGDEGYRSYGFAAYHQRFLPKAWHEIIKVHRDERLLKRMPAQAQGQELWSDWVDAQATDIRDTESHPSLTGFKDTLTQSLRFALRERQSWDVFYGMIYRGESALALAARFSVSQGHISDKVTDKILQTLRSLFTAYYECRVPRRIKITSLRGPLSDLLPEPDFLALVPRPFPPLPTPSAAALPLPRSSSVLVRRGRSR